MGIYPKDAPPNQKDTCFTMFISILHVLPAFVCPVIFPGKYNRNFVKFVEFIGQYAKMAFHFAKDGWFIVKEVYRWYSK